MKYEMTSINLGGVNQMPSVEQTKAMLMAVV